MYVAERCLGEEKGTVPEMADCGPFCLPLWGSPWPHRCLPCRMARMGWTVPSAVTAAMRMAATPPRAIAAASRDGQVRAKEMENVPIYA